MLVVSHIVLAGIQSTEKTYRIDGVFISVSDHEFFQDQLLYTASQSDKRLYLKAVGTRTSPILRVASGQTGRVYILLLLASVVFSFRRGCQNINLVISKCFSQLRG